MMDVEPAWDDELNAWYADEHLPRLLEVPGMAELAIESFFPADEQTAAVLRATWADEDDGAVR